MTLPPNGLCCACGACTAACPKNCIELRENERRERRPQIAAERCVDCGACVKACPMQPSAAAREEGEAPLFFSLRLSDAAARRASTSGGAFSAIVWAVCREGDAVYGAAYRDHGRIAHVRRQLPETLTPLQKSKYGPSEIAPECYRQIGADLREGRTVVFSGLPCQTAAVKRLYPKAERLFTVELVCHGTPEAWIYADYLARLEARHHSSIEAIDFRDKSRGWENPFLTIRFQSGRRYRRLAFAGDDPYMQAYLGGYLMMEACYQCPFAQMPRCADFTLGDYWLAGEAQAAASARDGGVSLVLANSARAKALMEKLPQFAQVQPVDPGPAMAANAQLVRPSQRHEQAAAFQQALGREGWETAAARFLRRRPAWLRLLMQLPDARMKRGIKRLLRRR